MTSLEFADILREMHARKRCVCQLLCILYDLSTTCRYGKMLVVLDTCYAEPLFDYIDAPNITAIASSGRDERSESVCALSCSHAYFRLTASRTARQVGTARRSFDRQLHTRAHCLDSATQRAFDTGTITP
jgi:hypothetical protein